MPVTEVQQSATICDVQNVLKDDNRLRLMDPKNLGRVYIRDECGTETVLDGAKFNKLDCKWYCSDGSIHPAFHMYRGRKMSLKFNFKNKDKNGNLVDSNVSLLCPLGVGQTGTPDWAGIADAEIVEREYAWRFGAFKDKDDPYVEGLGSAAATAFAAFLSPNKKVSELLPLVIHTTFLYVMDDVCDTCEVDNCQMTYKDKAAMYEAVEDVLRNDADPETIPNNRNIPQLQVICKYAKHLKMYLDANCRASSVKMWVSDMIQTSKAATLVGSKEWEEYKQGPARETARRMHYDVRLWDAAMIPSADIQQMVYGHQLDPAVESSYLHRHIVECVGMHVALVNDIVSYRKEIKEKHTFNVCHTKHTVGKMSLEDAFVETAKEADGLVYDVLETEKLLLQLYGEDSPHLKDALFLYKSNMVGHVQWFSYAMRYHDGVVLDVIVHPESF